MSRFASREDAVTVLPERRAGQIRMRDSIATAALAALSVARRVVGATRIAPPPVAREVHGSADVFAAPGVALAWGVAARRDRSATRRRRAHRHRSRERSRRWRSIGIDPFTQGGAADRCRPRAIGDQPIDVRVPRAHFADFPRTEFACSVRNPAGADDAPKLVVFYLGVPDTTPEFASDGGARNLPRRAHRPRARRHREARRHDPRIELARLLDHSVLKPEATERDVLAGADIVRKWQIGYYCVQPCWVSLAAQSLARHEREGGERRRLSARRRPHRGEGAGRCARRGRWRGRDRHGA